MGAKVGLGRYFRLDERQQPSAPLRLFCLPYAGGGGSTYRRWSKLVPRWADVVPVILPGRESRIAETPFTRMDLLADDLVDALQPHLDTPYALFGHSMGALLAFEVCRRACNRGLGPFRLFVSGRRSPEAPSRHRHLHELPADEFRRQLRALNGTPLALLDNPEVLELVMPVLRADFELCEKYQYRAGAPLPCPISAFLGSSDPETSADDLKLWEGHTRSTFRLRVFPGDHFFVETGAEAVVAAIVEELSPVVR